jgi:hypothetical protein
MTEYKLVKHQVVYTTSPDRIFVVDDDQQSANIIQISNLSCIHLFAEGRSVICFREVTHRVVDLIGNLDKHQHLFMRTSISMQLFNYLFLAT